MRKARILWEWNGRYCPFCLNGTMCFHGNRQIIKFGVPDCWQSEPLLLWGIHSKCLASWKQQEQTCCIPIYTYPYLLHIYIYYSILYYAYVCGILCTTVGSSWPKKQLRRRLDRCEEHGITPSGSWNLALRRNSMKIEDPWLNQVHIYIYYYIIYVV